jgi:HEPN domain-containing protein
MSNPDDPASWTAKADNDLLCIANNLNDPRVPWDAVCFHAQQAAEKMLKAFLVSRGLRVQRTHDLALLLGQCAAAGNPFDHLAADCELLNIYAVTFRYPAPAAPDPTDAEGRAAVAAAQRVYDAVRAALAGSQAP